MKNILMFFIFLFYSFLCNAQFFQATIQKNGNDLIFQLRANPGGDDITTQWSDLEFFIRWPDGSPAFNFGEITVNSTDFPGISIPNNGINAQGSEVGYSNNWFGTSFSTTPFTAYTAGVEYEVFRVALDVPSSDISFELVHNDLFSPHYLALINGNGSDLSNVVGNMFYSERATICPSSNNCPVSTFGSNHVDVGANALLPVELISFTASKLEKEVLLEWETASENQNKGFLIERRNVSDDWMEIGFVEGGGTTANFSNYEFFDRNPLVGINYYRLKQLDFDGTSEYSNIRAVKFEKAGMEIFIFPNPTSDVVNIEFTESNNGGHLQLIDQFGSVVMEKVLSEKEYVKTFHLGHLSKGVYFIHIRHGDQRTVERIVLQ